MRLACEMRVYSSACQSCDSICVVSGFQSRPRLSTNSREMRGQSASGIGDEVRGERAGRAAELAQVLAVPRSASRTRSSRWTKTASSLPMVVGVAG